MFTGRVAGVMIFEIVRNVEALFGGDVTLHCQMTEGCSSRRRNGLLLRSWRDADVGDTLSLFTLNTIKNYVEVHIDFSQEPHH